MRKFNNEGCRHRRLGSRKPHALDLQTGPRPPRRAVASHAVELCGCLLPLGRPRFMVSLTTTAKMLWVSPGGLGLSAIVAGTRWLRRLLGKMTGLTVLLAAHALP